MVECSTQFRLYAYLSVRADVNREIEAKPLLIRFFSRQINIYCYEPFLHDRRRVLSLWKSAVSLSDSIGFWPGASDGAGYHLN